MNFPINIEQWRLINGYDNYEISSHGRVRNNKTSRIMKLILNRNGYFTIYLSRDGQPKFHNVHRLVAFAFLDRNEDQTDVDHINHNRKDNRIKNLRDVTRKQNQMNKKLNPRNTTGHNGVSWYKNYKKWVAYIRIDSVRHHLGYFENKYEAIKRVRAESSRLGFHKNHGL